MAPNLDVRLTLQQIRCYQQNESQHAEPYLWPVFFKIDGDSVVFDLNTMKLSGKATVVAPNGSPRNLGRSRVHSGEWFSIPASIGEYVTELKPIPVRPVFGALTDVPSIIGSIAILLEEDNTPDNVVRRAYEALHGALQSELDALIPTFGLTKMEAGDDEIQAILNRVTAAVKTSVMSSSLFDLLKTVADPDDQIGYSAEVFGYDQLFRNSVVTWQQTWQQEGEWALDGRIEAHARYEFDPNQMPKPIRLVPVTGGGGNAWTGSWYAKPPGAGASAITVRIDPAPDGKQNVQAVQSIKFPPISVQAQGAETRLAFDEPYKRDVWTLNFNTAPVRRRPGFPVAPVAPIVRFSPPGNREQAVARFPAVDQISLPRNVRLQLYAEETPDGRVERHRVRYIRTRDDGATVEDVMLGQRLVW